MRALGGEFGFYVFLMVLVCGRMVEGEDEFVCEEPNGGCNVGGISRILGDVVVIVWMVQLGDGKHYGVISDRGLHLGSKA